MNDKYEIKCKMFKEIGINYWVIRNLKQYGNCYINPIEEGRYPIIIKKINEIFNSELKVDIARDFGYVITASEEEKQNADLWIEEALKVYSKDKKEFKEKYCIQEEPDEIFYSC